MTHGHIMKLPPAVRAWLVDYIERSWPTPDAIVAAIPSELPAGEVRNLARGGPFGLMLDGRLDEIDGRVALEALENSRMSGEVYFRVWDDGTTEALHPAPLQSWSYAPDASPEEREAAEAAYYAHNRRAYDLLKERGFLRF